MSESPLKGNYESRGQQIKILQDYMYSFSNFDKNRVFLKEVKELQELQLQKLNQQKDINYLQIRKVNSNMNRNDNCKQKLQLKASLSSKRAENITINEENANYNPKQNLTILYNLNNLNDTNNEKMKDTQLKPKRKLINSKDLENLSNLYVSNYISKKNLEFTPQIQIFEVKQQKEIIDEDQSQLETIERIELSKRNNCTPKIKLKNNNSNATQAKDLNNHDTNNLIQVSSGNLDKSSPKKIFKLENIHKTYLIGIEGFAAIRGVNLEINQGEFVCIFGNSGCGKSSLLNIMGTIDKPSRGNIYICGKLINSQSEEKVLSNLRLSKLAFVFQSYNLIPNISAVENVKLPMKIRGILSEKEMTKKSCDLLIKFGLQNRINHYPNQLSGGEQQRIAIARALANDPKVILLDEPTGDLDTKNTDLIMSHLIKINSAQGKKITIVMVTHDLSLKSYGTKIIKMLDGKIESVKINPEENRLKSIAMLESRISNSNKEFITIQTGIDEKEKNEIKEANQMIEAINYFPINFTSKSKSTTVRIPSDYGPLKDQAYEGYKYL